MNVLQAAIAGAIQGLTEFLPVSSSGQLAIFYALTGGAPGGNLSFSVFLHFATLMSVVFAFRGELRALLRDAFFACAGFLGRKPERPPENGRFILMLIIATLPAGAAGVLLKVTGLGEILENIFVASAMLLVTAVLMFLTDGVSVGAYTKKNAPLKTPLFVGLAQAAAVLPGLSRSGATIFAGLKCGLTREAAVNFAFLLSVPVVLGAFLLEITTDSAPGALSLNPAPFAAGFAAAFACGVFSVKAIKTLLNGRKFYVFGVYCVISSIIGFLAGFGVI